MDKSVTKWCQVKSKDTKTHYVQLGIVLFVTYRDQILMLLTPLLYVKLLQNQMKMVPNLSPRMSQRGRQSSLTTWMCCCSATSDLIMLLLMLSKKLQILWLVASVVNSQPRTLQ